MKNLIIITTAFALCSTAALAQDYRAQIFDRQHRQQERIQQGIDSGSLTPKEAHKLQAEQASITHAIERAESKGEVTTKERQAIEHKQDAASKHIARQTHDAQVAY